MCLRMALGAFSIYRASFVTDLEPLPGGQTTGPSWEGISVGKEKEPYDCLSNVAEGVQSRDEQTAARNMARSKGGRKKEKN